jgi:hypothetical protein
MESALIRGNSPQNGEFCSPAELAHLLNLLAHPRKSLARSWTK